MKMHLLPIPTGLVLFAALWMVAGWGMAQVEEDRLDRKVRISLPRGTRYEYLNQLSDQTGLLFLYDSRIIRNDQVIRLPQGEYELRQAILAITGEPELVIRLSGQHILLSQRKDPELAEREAFIYEIAVTPEQWLVTGIVCDRITREPIPYCAVTFGDGTTGTVTNREGEFALRYTGTEPQASVRFSHVGYLSQSFELALLDNQYFRFDLDPKIVPLQEVVVRPVDPYREIREMHRHRPVNYSRTSFGLISFYREEIQFRNKTVSLTEGVLQAYHAGYESNEEEQVRLIKMRKIIDPGRTPEKMPKMKSGIASILRTDLIKYPADFMDPDQPECVYEYVHSGSTYLDGRRIHIIGFEQKPGIAEPFFLGELYIDAENHALVEVHFEVHPEYVRKATDFYVERTGKGVRLSLVRASYRISYKPAEDGKYYCSHSRGDLEFRIRMKRGVFTHPLRFGVEILHAHIDTGNVRPIPRTERLHARKVFAETTHPYDADFWNDFNVILPEESLQKLILDQPHEVTVPVEQDIP